MQREGRSPSFQIEYYLLGIPPAEFPWVLYFALLPMLQVLVRSFQSAIGSRWVGIQNYVTVMGNAAFQRAIANTGRFTAVCIPLLIVISLALAVLLYSIPAVGSALRSIFLMPIAVPAASVVLVWKVLFHEKGLITVIHSSFPLGCWI